MTQELPETKTSESSENLYDGAFRERIVNVSRRRAGDVERNPRNPKRYTDEKQKRLTAVLSQYGKAGVLLTYRDDDGVERFFDGNTRQGIDPDEVWWVAETDFTQAEVDGLVMLYDPLAAPDWEAEMLKVLAESTAADREAAPDLAALMDEVLAAIVQPSEGEWGSAFGSLPDEDRAPFQQMTFTLHDTQVEQVKAALGAARAMGEFDSENENSNGNALARICETFLTKHGDG